MSSRGRKRHGSGTAFPTAAVCAALSVALGTALSYTATTSVTTLKWLGLAAALAAVGMLAFLDLKPLWKVGTLCLTAYVAFGFVSAFWAMSGKFCLRDAAKTAAAFALFLLVTLWPRFDRAFVRRVLLAAAWAAAIYAVLSVEAGSTGLVKTLLDGQGLTEGMTVGYKNGRLFGILGNSNIEAAIYGMGIFAALGALSGAESRRERAVSMVLTVLCSFAFLLCVSLGAMASFAAGVVLCLIAAGRTRLRLLLRMLAAALPTLLFAVLAASCFTSRPTLVLLLMAAAAAVAALLELKCVDGLSTRLERYQRLPLLALLLAAALGAVYLAVAINLTGPYTFGGRLSRRDYTAPGEHTLRIEADGNVRVAIYSQTYEQAMLNTYTRLYSAYPRGGELSFTVPEDSIVILYRFAGKEGVTLQEALIDGEKALPLDYRIMPSFVANRLQGVKASNSLVVRRALWTWGLRLFRLSPAVGNGPGAFESGIRRVEDISFDTKYPHNHYIRQLVEFGVIGFALYMGVLLCAAAALVKKRRAAAEDEAFGWSYPAVCGAFTMACLLTFWDLSMSNILFLSCVFVLWGLIFRMWGTPLPVKKTAVGAVTAARVACAAFPALFLVTLCGNLWANKLSETKVTSYDGYFINLERAADIDIYEKNDWKLSYIMSAIQVEGGEQHFSRADAYAAELMEEQSNSLPRYLTAYYAERGQYLNAIRAAKCSARYSAADPNTWNTIIPILWEGVVRKPGAMDSQMETLAPELEGYLNLLIERNETAIQEITLTEENQAIFDAMCGLVEAWREAPETAAQLLQELTAANR